MTAQTLTGNDRYSLPPVQDGDRLSPAAQRLYERVSNPRNWYAVGAARTPRAMRELVDAGLVREGARMPVVRSYYVPTAYRMTYRETYPNDAGHARSDAPDRRSFKARRKL